MLLFADTRSSLIFFQIFGIYAVDDVKYGHMRASNIPNKVVIVYIYFTCSLCFVQSLISLSIYYIAMYMGKPFS